MKKFLALALSLIMVLSLVACGGSKKEEPKQEETKTEETADPLRAYEGTTINVMLAAIFAEGVTVSEIDSLRLKSVIYSTPIVSFTVTKADSGTLSPLLFST